MIDVTRSADRENEQVSLDCPAKSGVRDCREMTGRDEPREGLQEDAAITMNTGRDPSDAGALSGNRATGEVDWSNLFECSPEMTLVIGADRRVLRANCASVELLGYRADELLEMRVEDLAVAGEEKRIAACIARCGETGPESLETALRTKDGRRIDVRMTVALCEDGCGSPVAFFAFFKDMTERKQIESYLVRSNRLNGIGALAADAAHELNNILATILLASQMIKLEADGNKRVLKQAHNISKGAEGGGELVSNLLCLARAPGPESQGAEPNFLLRSCCSLLKRSLNASVKVELDLDETIPCVGAGRVQLAHVILNLTMNAGDAMPDGGTLTLVTRLIAGTDENRLKDLGLKSAQYVCISVIDTGMGIEEKLRGKIFEPFFTTRNQSERTGLGLFVANKVVTALGGAMEVLSDVGRGSRLNVYIPAMQEPKQSNDDEVSSEQLCGTEHILVVDDKSDVRESISQMLRLWGYRVSTAEDGPSAVELYTGASEAVDLVIMDLRMPGVDGLETFTRLKEKDPDVIAILTSGYGRDRTVSEAKEQGVAGFIKKPYKIEQLLRLIRGLLDKSSSSKDS